MNIPETRVIQEQYKGLVMFWLSEKGKKSTMRGKESRKKKILNHITGRKPFAQVRANEERKKGYRISRADTFSLCYPVEKGGGAGQLMDQMQALTNELGGLEDIISRDDVYAKIYGPEKPGRVRMLGRGVTQQDVFEEIPSRKSCFRMIQTLQERLNKLEESRNEVIAPNGPSSSSYEDRNSIPNSTNNLRPLRVHSSVYLMSIMDRNEVVAKGYLKSMDPSTEVGGQVLGRNYYEVHINITVKEDEDLVRPYMHFNTISDAQGISVAWPIPLVVPDEND